MTGMGSHQSAAPVTTTWLTPPDLLAKLGGPDAFDLDPCAAIGQPWRTARRQLTEAEDGLSQPWHGRVWLNPPYTTAEIPRWLGRLADHDDGIALIFARTETAAFHRLVWERCDALLFLEGRLFFHDQHGVKANANAGAPSVLCAYGPGAAAALHASRVPGAYVHLRTRPAVKQRLLTDRP